MDGDVTMSEYVYECSRVLSRCWLVDADQLELELKHFCRVAD